MPLDYTVKTGQETTVNISINGRRPFFIYNDSYIYMSLLNNMVQNKPPFRLESQRSSHHRQGNALTWLHPQRDDQKRSHPQSVVEWILWNLPSQQGNSAPVFPYVEQFFPRIRLKSRDTEALWRFLRWWTSIPSPDLEAACSKALSYTPSPSHRGIKKILTTGQDKVTVEETPSTNNHSAAYGFTRGSDYYGRNSWW